VGLKVTLIVQLAPAAKELPQLWVCAKSAALVAVIAIPLIEIVVVPMLVRVTVLVLRFPRATVPKFRLVADSFAVVPIPLRITVCGLPLALSEMLNPALRLPDAVGLKVMLILQLAPTASELPQV
jgi:hypothetical protein